MKFDEISCYATVNATDGAKVAELAESMKENGWKAPHPRVQHGPRHRIAPPRRAQGDRLRCGIRRRGSLRGRCRRRDRRDQRLPRARASASKRSSSTTCATCSPGRGSRNTKTRSSSGRRRNEQGHQRQAVDTDKAEQIAQSDNGCYVGDLDYYCETLYRKRTGEFFCTPGRAAHEVRQARRLGMGRRRG
ncbi:MAG: hypothetical protein ACLSVD_02870 [Eggerthellaceae bacterium]